MKKLTNLPANYEKAFYKERAERIDKLFASPFQQSILTNQLLSNDVKNYLLATSESGQDIQSEIDLYVTKGCLNKTSFRRKLDLIAKNIIRHNNLIELVFKEILKLNAQNLLIGSFTK